MGTLRVIVRLACIALVGALVLAANDSHLLASDTKEPIVSEKPLTSEQLAIYHEILRNWMDDGKHSVNLALNTVPLEEEAKTCVKNVQMEVPDSAIVHRFRPEDLSRLGSNKIRLVDPESQAKEIKENDPGKAIRNGKSVDQAVENGFAHGLVTLSEIQFDEKHEVAVVWYGFTCGGLCGNGATVVFEKKNGAWQMRKAPCSVWMS